MGELACNVQSMFHVVFINLVSLSPNEELYRQMQI